MAEVTKFWGCLEDLRGLVHVPAGWRARLDGEFDAVRGAFLRARPGASARSYPCPRECGCFHEVVRHEDGRIVGVCRCESWNCDDIPLKEEDLVLLELNWSRLGRGIAKALGCEAKEATLGVPGLLQVGSFGSDGLPVVLCIQHEPGELRAALAELGLRLQRPFALLAPTGRLMDAHCHAMIASARARFFGLESNLRLMASGTLVAEKQAADLFAALAPEPAKELGPGEAARVFRLFGELLGMGTDLVAPPARVFDLMVFKKMTKAEAALECGCVASLITKRVALIERHFAMPMERLLAFASDLKDRQRTVRGDRYARKKQGAARDTLQQYADGDRPGAKEDDDGYLPEEKQSWADS